MGQVLEDTSAIVQVAEAAERLLNRIAETAPRVHCLTNTVAQPITANALLAVGAIPSLTSDPEELPEFLRSADALMVNLGTPNDESRAAWHSAAGVAVARGMPWVLDPVMVDRTTARSSQAHQLIQLAPTAIRCNGAEAETLSGALPGYSGVLARTGKDDVIEQAGRKMRLTVGDPMLARVTATGCALSAMVAAFLAVGRDDPFMGVSAAIAAFGAAGALAAEKAKGPGSLAVVLLDELAAVNAQRITDHAGRLARMK